MKRVYTILAICLWATQAAFAQWGGELRFCVRANPKTFHPLLVSEQPEETIRYLTAGVLVRLNRASQKLEPELAESWSLADGGRAITFRLRQGLQFSDGSALQPEDLLSTLNMLFDPQLHSPWADAFGPKRPKISLASGLVTVRFPETIAGLEALFDQVPVTAARAVAKAVNPSEMPVLGPYRVAEFKTGSYVLLTRNPHYWKTGPGGRRLPYLDSIRLSIQQNRDVETLRFTRGEIDLIDTLDPDSMERLKGKPGIVATDAGPGLESEFVWFNQAPNAPIPVYKKDWFRAREFRRAISEAINRADLCRVVYKDRAAPAVGPVSPANRYWFNSRLRPEPFDRKEALAKLASAGFRLEGGALKDRGGNAVEFSVITNSGNKLRERMAAMLQQDLSAIGIRLNVVPLDFASLIERVTRTANYETCLLGLTNVELDPNGQMNVWLSSAATHPWNPSQKTPATPWEAEIDRLMLQQAAAPPAAKRKAAFDRVQEIVVQEAPILYLVNKNTLLAYSSRLQNTAPVILHPQAYWNIEQMYLAPLRAAAGGSR